ncbi:MAG TPA: response regulator [Blastocatellia bacterium]|nr:response regulator [Blastocatellia bacterium]
MGYKILLADDSVTVQKIITLTFTDEGVDVVTVDNGDEAISRLQYMRPALVMADVSIPGRNGYEICEFVKLHPEMRDTPVILLVPAFEPYDEERARRIGADYHLTKPFQSIRTLISTVKNLMERKADHGLSVGGSGLTAVPESDRADSLRLDVDRKRAKIDELIKLSAQPAPENGAEDESLLEVDLTQGGGRQSDSLAAVSAPDLVEADLVEEVEVIDIRRNAAPETRLRHDAQTLGSPTQNWRASNEDLDVNLNMDNILELEDVLPEVEFTRVGGVVPQSVIDEIVNRVTVQLSEKLSGEIARRIAPEVAELVKRQFLVEPAVYRDSDNLLDLD